MTLYRHIISHRFLLDGFPRDSASACEIRLSLFPIQCHESAVRPNVKFNENQKISVNDHMANNFKIIQNLCLLHQNAFIVMNNLFRIVVYVLSFTQHEMCSKNGVFKTFTGISAFSNR